LNIVKRSHCKMLSSGAVRAAWWQRFRLHRWAAGLA
jgi:hypothetical protein